MLPSTTGTSAGRCRTESHTCSRRLAPACSWPVTCARAHPIAWPPPSVTGQWPCGSCTTSWTADTSSARFHRKADGDRRAGSGRVARHGDEKVVLRRELATADPPREVKPVAPSAVSVVEVADGDQPGAVLV